MFQLASGGSTSAGSMSMMGMQRTHDAVLHAEPVSFYLGLALLLSAFAFSFWRRRRRQCKAVFRLREPLTARR